MKKPIHFIVTEGAVAQSVCTYEGEYRNLMFLLADQIYLESFGECGGLGRCATCVVKVTGLQSDSASATTERNEPVTLAKAGYTQKDIRLSCQIYITDALEGALIEIC